MSQQAVPKYAAGLKIPVCERKRADMLHRGDWIIANFASNTPMVMVVVYIEKTATAVFLDLAAYPNKRVKRTWRTSIIRMPSELMSVLTGSVE